MPVDDLATEETKSRVTPHRGNRRAIVVGTVLVVVIGIGFLVVRQHRTAAEAEARDTLKKLGALVMLDARHKHVQQVDFRMPAVKAHLDEAIRLLPKLPHVRIVRLSGTAVTNDQLKYLTGLDSLTTIDLGKTGISDAGLAHLGGLGNLQRLFLGNTQVTTASLAHIGNMSDLEILDLSGTKIDGDLAPLANLANLNHLLMNYIQLSDAALATLGELPNLSRLTINGSTVSDTALQELRQVRPKIGIDH